ncbi:hypothetical protein MXD62_32550 [Frankia sp. Mgl5]|nr:hypothetical protein [Frankia sp. Mgl5]
MKIVNMSSRAGRRAAPSRACRDAVKAEFFRTPGPPDSIRALGEWPASEPVPEVRLEASHLVQQLGMQTERARRVQQPCTTDTASSKARVRRAGERAALEDPAA